MSAMPALVKVVSAAAGATGTIVDTAKLGELIITAFIAGVGVTAVYAIVIFGAARSAEMRRADRHLAASVLGLVSTAALVVVAAAVAYAIYLMTHK
jgi:uncharacterized membrane protein YidH (DUF202 family)